MAKKITEHSGMYRPPKGWPRLSQPAAGPMAQGTRRERSRAAKRSAAISREVAAG